MEEKAYAAGRCGPPAVERAAAGPALAATAIRWVPATPPLAAPAEADDCGDELVGVGVDPDVGDPLGSGWKTGASAAAGGREAGADPDPQAVARASSSRAAIAGVRTVVMQAPAQQEGVRRAVTL
ncbi:MAG: hypothetical protein NVSMB55_03220 [Mycobacteriales bacterium]